MHPLLQYPFDPQLILRKRKSIRRELLETPGLVEKRIAILGGSTTHDVMEMMELFLLDQGIRPVFYESEYGMYWQDAMFGSPGLSEFRPDVVYVHTSSRNIPAWPKVDGGAGEAESLLEQAEGHFSAMWERLAERYRCPVIQNNFEYPLYRLLGNMDASDPRGGVNFVTRLNLWMYDYAAAHEGFFVNDINYLSADYGLEKWSDPLYWHMYKYCCHIDAVPALAFSVSNIIKSLFGKNKKALALDLDNTLWGGVVGDDGVEGLEIGRETPMGQAYLEFQQYVREQERRGVVLCVVSKNEMGNALAGLGHPDGVLRPEDFAAIKANWDPKSANLAEAAGELSLLPESFVFVDDNPAEREIVRRQLPGVPAPEIGKVEHYAATIDRCGFFEATSISGDDLGRARMYRENADRERLKASFEDYGEYLRSLEMVATIRPFDAVHFSRIAQLTNKSNQFNLTTRRCTREEIEAAASDPAVVTLCGRLEDRFGDNGVVSVVIAEEKGDALDIVLWLMSCRVLKRDMEFAMMDALAERAIGRGVKRLVGHYYPTAKNAMVRDFYALQGFSKVAEDGEGNTEWELDLSGGYERRQDVIEVRG